MKEAKEIKVAVDNAAKIVITSHRSPDGDSIGSSVAMYRYLKKIGKNVIICHPDPAPEFLHWITEDAELINFEDDQPSVIKEMHEADLIFCLDYNGSDRMGRDMGVLLDECTATKVMLDHHPHPADFVDIAVTQTNVCSTCQIVYEYITACGDEDVIDAMIGEAIYLGIMTDTGSFRYSSLDARTHEIISKLLTKGLVHTPIHENTFDGVRIDRLKLRGYAMSEKLEVIPHYHIAYIALSSEELERFHYRKGDTDGLVNVALSVEGVQVAVFFSEKDGQIKISFRSKGDVAVNELAINEFNGGGHRNAAGGVSQESLEDTIKRFKSVIPKYFAHIND